MAAALQAVPAQGAPAGSLQVEHADVVLPRKTGEPLEGRQAAHSEGWEQEAKAGGEDGVYSGPVEVPLLGRDSGPLSAILPVSYFVHNLVITLMQGPEPTHIKMRQHAAAFGRTSGPQTLNPQPPTPNPTQPCPVSTAPAC